VCPAMGPALVYDDDCGFCTWWAEFVGDRSDLRLVGFTELSEDLIERLPEDYETCAHLVTEETVYSCGAAAEEALVRTEQGREARPLVEFLRGFEDYERTRERLYRLGADNRDVFGQFLSAPTDDGREH